MDPLAFILHSLTIGGFHVGLFKSFHKTMAGSLSIVSTAVESAYIGMADSGEVGRLRVCSNYINGLSSLLWGTATLNEKNYKRI